MIVSLTAEAIATDPFGRLGAFDVWKENLVRRFFGGSKKLKSQGGKEARFLFVAELTVRLPVHEIVYGPDTGRKGPGQGRRTMLHTGPTLPSGVPHQEGACFMMWQAHFSSPPNPSKGWS